MRTREDVETDLRMPTGTSKEHIAIELLLDIRELLKAPPLQISVGVQPDSEGLAKKVADTIRRHTIESNKIPPFTKIRKGME